MNDYEKAFVERINGLKIAPGPAFASLVRVALGREMGGEEESLLSGLSQATLEDPRRLAMELYNTYGEGAMQYLVMIVRFAESGEYHPEEDQELEREDEELESVIGETESERNGEQEV